MLSIDSWIRFALTEIYAILLLAVVFRRPMLEEKIVSLSNTNKMLHPESVYFNGRIKGVKTGTTSRAGNCLVSVFTVGDYRYLCVVMHSSYDGKFRDTQALYDVCAEAK